jgi:hypothetical protein
MDRTELPLGPRQIKVPSSVSKMISMPMVCSVKTMHLSCTDTNTVSKWTKMRLHTTHITYEFYRVRPKLFMSLWYVQCKPCTFLASRLALSTNGPNRASTWASSPWSPIKCVQNDSISMVCSVQTVHLSCTHTYTVSKRTKTRFHMTHVTYKLHRVRPKPFMSLWYV